MAIIDLGKIKPINRGDWNSSDPYALDDFVRHGAHTFICKQAHTGQQPYQQDTGTLNSSYWDFMAKGSEIQNRGAWDSVTTYTVNDVVQHGNSSFICKTAPALNEDPFNESTGVLNSAYWSFFARGDRVVNKGTWNASTAYVLNDFVIHGKHTFICIQSHTGEDPYDENTSTLNSTYWEFLAQGTAQADWSATSGDSLIINKPKILHPGLNVTAFPKMESGYRGYRHTSVLMENGTVRSWGGNETGSHGDGVHHGARHRSTSPGVPGVVTKLFQTRDAGCALTEEGELYGWGHNGYGSFGWNNGTHYYFPRRIPLPSGMVRFVDMSMACEHSHRNSHALYVAENSSGQRYVYACGYNGYGQIGVGNTTHYYTLQQVSTLNNKGVIEVMAQHGNYGQSMARCANGDAYVWGWNGYGECGVGHRTNNVYTPRRVQDHGVPSDSPVKQIWCDGHGSHGRSWVVLEDGRMYACGYQQSYGVFGHNNTSAYNSWTQCGGVGGTNVEMVRSMGSSNCCAIILRKDGMVHTIGYNGHGQLGIGNTTNHNTWQTPPANVNRGGHGEITKPCNDGNAVAVFINNAQSASGAVMSFIRDDGNWSIDGVTNLKKYPVTPGDLNAGGGTLWIWGYNGNSGMLGTGHSTNNSTWNGVNESRIPQYACCPKNVIDYRAYGADSETTPCVLTADGQVMTTGYSGSGALGRETDDERILTFGAVHL